jgi:hypothetical protein
VIIALSDKDSYTTWKVPAGWNRIIEAWREKHAEGLETRMIRSNSAAVLYILTRVMENEGILEELDVKV